MWFSTCSSLQFKILIVIRHKFFFKIFIGERTLRKVRIPFLAGSGKNFRSDMSGWGFDPLATDILNVLLDEVLSVSVCLVLFSFHN